ncbi:hypothetical protein TNCV_3349321 [Trichonephila clavipes]|nr:hypothetical protein TNCV_3349321 [Trichonephila clavipes]
MTSARGHGAIVYCLHSGSEDRQTGRHNGERRRREETEKEREKKEDEKGERESRRKKEKKRSRGRERERERSPPCMEKRAESGDWSEKDDERRWR